jgi:hypothetical protein
VTVPYDSSWRVVGVQGRFQAYEMGTLQVPGTLTALGVPAAPAAEDLDRYWPGPARPPVLPVDQTRDPYGAIPEIGASPVVWQSAVAVAAAEDPRRSRAVPTAVGWTALVLLAGAGVVMAARRSRSRPRTQPVPPPPIAAGNG